MRLHDRKTRAATVQGAANSNEMINFRTGRPKQSGGCTTLPAHHTGGWPGITAYHEAKLRESWVGRFGFCPKLPRVRQQIREGCERLSATGAAFCFPTSATLPSTGSTDTRQYPAKQNNRNGFQGPVEYRFKHGEEHQREQRRKKQYKAVRSKQEADAANQDE